MLNITTNIKNNLTTLLVFSAFLAFCQKPYKFDDKLAGILPGNQIETSSITYFNNRLYVVAEKCCRIYVIDIPTRAVVQTIILCDTKKDNYQFEGIGTYDSCLYLVDEYNHTLWKHDLRNGKTIQNTFTVPAGYSDSNGFESIAVNPAGYIYIQQEKPVNGNTRLLYIFKLDNLSAAVDTINIQSNDENNTRVCDMYFDAGKKQLVCLKTNMYVYQISTIDIDSTGKPYNYENAVVTDISKPLNTACNGKYHKNIEGLCTDGQGTLYIVSDNASTDSSKCDVAAQAGKRSALFTLKRTP